MSTNKIQPLPIKLVVVGDGTVGKTCILLSFAKNQFPKEYEPTVFDNLTTTIKINGQLINLGLWDTAGQEQYSTLRQLAYPGTNIFLIIFSIESEDSFKNALKKWYPQISQCVPSSTIIFVGNKIDLRGMEKRSGLIDKEMAARVIEKQTKCMYFQCSALTQKGLKEIFQESAKIIIAKKLGGSSGGKKVQKKESSCLLI